MKVSYVVLFIMGLALVTGCSHYSVMGPVNRPDIIIIVDNAGNARINTPGNSNCTRTNPIPQGCLRYLLDEFGEVKFQLNGPTAWAFESMQICKLDGNIQDCELDLWDRIQFAIKNEAGDILLIPDEQGKVDLTVFADDDEYFLVNQNTVLQDYYYSVDVCNNGGVCITVDPPIENGGRR